MIVEGNGVCLEVVKKNAFPQLVFENKAVIEKMFDWVKGDVDIHTRLLPFDAFASLVIAFNTKTVDQKIDRFFKLIDLDGNGKLSWDEIRSLCKRNLCAFKAVEDNSDEDKFYSDLAESFAKAIFKCIGIPEKMFNEHELTADEMREAMNVSEENA